MDEQRLLQLGSRLELSEQAVHVMDVPRAFDLRHHHDLELVADLGHQPRDVVEHPRRVETVDARPQLALAEIHFLGDAHQALACVDLLVRGDRVLEVAEQDVALPRQIRHLGGHLRVARVEEVDHA